MAGEPVAAPTVKETPSVSSADITASSPAGSATSAAALGANVSPAPAVKKKKHIALWDIDEAGVKTWIGTVPGPLQSNGTALEGDKVKSMNDEATTTAVKQGTCDRTPWHLRRRSGCIFYLLDPNGFLKETFAETIVLSIV